METSRFCNGTDQEMIIMALSDLYHAQLARYTKWHVLDLPDWYKYSHASFLLEEHLYICLLKIILRLIKALVIFTTNIEDVW